jgi:hypothetical protein
MIMIMIHGMNNIIFMIAIYNAPLGFEVSPDRCCTQSHRAPWHLILVERPQEVSHFLKVLGRFQTATIPWDDLSTVYLSQS